MELPTVGSVAFVIALVAFFTTQFNLQGNKALLCAFLVALIFSLSPLLAASLPQVAPFVDAITQTVLLTISAAGGYDFITRTVRKINSPSG